MAGFTEKRQKTTLYSNLPDFKFHFKAIIFKNVWQSHPM